MSKSLATKTTSFQGQGSEKKHLIHPSNVAKKVKASKTIKIIH